MLNGMPHAARCSLQMTGNRHRTAAAVGRHVVGTPCALRPQAGSAESGGILARVSRNGHSLAFPSSVRDRLSIDHGPPWARAARHARYIPPQRGPVCGREHVVSPLIAQRRPEIGTPATFTIGRRVLTIPSCPHSPPRCAADSYANDATDDEMPEDGNDGAAASAAAPEVRGPSERLQTRT